MQIHLSDHFNYKKIFNITLAPILMMIFTSTYSVVDGVFISNFAGNDAYSGVNLIMPIIMIIGSIGFMYGIGGSALSAKLLGQKKDTEANQVFSEMLSFTFISGVIISIAVYFLIPSITNAMASITEGATEGMVNEANEYGKMLMLGQVFFMTENLFQSYFLVVERSKTGFFVNLFAGIANIIFDALFIAVFKWGVKGAALATILGYIVGSIYPMIYFIRHKELPIHLSAAKLNSRHIISSCFNGSSEFIGNIAQSVVGIVVNIQLLKYIGPNGVSAYGTIMYVSFLFAAIFIGYSNGIAPVIAYNYGAQNKSELKNITGKSLIIIGVSSLLMCIAELFGAEIMAKLFSSNDPVLEELTARALKISSFCYLFCGIAIFASSFFTALNNGLVSAIQSFVRTLIFHIGFVFILPMIIGQDGLWWAVVGSDLSAGIMGICFILFNKKKYGY